MTGTSSLRCVTLARYQHWCWRAWPVFPSRTSALQCRCRLDRGLRTLSWSATSTATTTSPSYAVSTPSSLVRRLSTSRMISHTHWDPPMMNASVITGYGKADETVDVLGVPIPKPQGNELLVKVHAASVNPLDVAMMNGYGRSLFPSFHALPSTLGRDCHGVVTACGSSVWDFAVGDVVYGAVHPFQSGTHAEYALVKETNAALAPCNLSPAEAASLPYALLSLYHALRDPSACLSTKGFSNLLDQLRGLVMPSTTAASTSSPGSLEDFLPAGTRVLIIGGGGAVGRLAVQLCKHFQCEVITTCNTDKDGDLLQSLGADVVLDYKTVAEGDDGAVVHPFVSYLRSESKSSSARSEFAGPVDVALNCASAQAQRTPSSADGALQTLEEAALSVLGVEGRYITMSGEFISRLDAAAQSDRRGVPLTGAADSLGALQKKKAWAREQYGVGSYNWAVYQDHPTNGKVLEDAAILIENGVLTPNVDRTFHVGGGGGGPSGAVEEEDGGKRLRDCVKQAYSYSEMTGGKVVIAVDV